MSKKHRHAKQRQPVAIAHPPVDARSLEYQNAVNAVRSFYSNAVAWGTNLLTDQRDEYSLDDVTVARLFGINVTSWACARFRAGVESGIPPLIVDIEERPIPDEDNPVLWFIKNHTRLMYRISISLLIWGKFFLLKIPNRAGKPTRLKWLSPLDVSPEIDYERNEFRGFRVRGYDQMIPPYRMITHMEFDPLNDFDGLSPFEVAYRQIVGGRELVRFAQKYFEEGTMLGGMLTYEGELSDEEKVDVKAEMAQFKGSQNAFKTFIAGGGLAKFDFKPMVPQPVDLAMGDFKQIIDEDTCTSFNVHPILIGKGSAKDPLSAQSTFEQIHQKFTLETAVPTVKLVFGVLDEHWLKADFSDWGDLRIIPDLSEINAVSKAQPERSQTAVANVDRIWTIDEGRDYTGRPKLPFPTIQINPDRVIAVYEAGGLRHSEMRISLGLKPDPKFQDGYIFEIDPRQKGTQSQLSFNVGASTPPETLPDASKRMLPAPDALDAEIVPTPPIQSDPVTTKAQLYELENWQKKVKRKGIGATFEHKHLSTPIVSFVCSELDGLWNPQAVFAEARSAVRAGRDPRPVGATPEEANEYWHRYDELKADLGRDFESYLRSVSDSAYGHVLEHRNADIDAMLSTQHGKLADAWIGDAAHPGPLLALILAGMEAGDKALQKEVAANPHKPTRAFDTGVSFDLLSQQALTYARSYAYDLIRQLDDTTKQGIRDALSKQITDGLTTDELRDMIANVLVPPGGTITEAIRNRAALIGHSESVGAFNAGAFKRWQDAGVTEATWQTVRDSHVCNICRPLHGVRARISDGWVSPTNGQRYTNRCHAGGRCFRRPSVN